MKEEVVEELIEQNRYIVDFVLNNDFYDLRNDEDLAQIGLIALWNAIITYKQGSDATLQTYARHCIKNQIIKELMKRKTTKRKLNDLQFTVSLQNTVSQNGNMMIDEITGTEDIGYFKSDIVDFIKKLEPQEREIVYNYANGVSMKQIATKVNKSRYLTKKCVYDVKQRLKQQCL